MKVVKSDLVRKRFAEWISKGGVDAKNASFCEEAIKKISKCESEKDLKVFRKNTLPEGFYRIHPEGNGQITLYFVKVNDVQVTNNRKEDIIFIPWVTDLHKKHSTWAKTYQKDKSENKELKDPCFKNFIERHSEGSLEKFSKKKYFGEYTISNVLSLDNPKIFFEIEMGEAGSESSSNATTYLDYGGDKIYRDLDGQGIQSSGRDRGQVRVLVENIIEEFDKYGFGLDLKIYKYYPEQIEMQNDILIDLNFDKNESEDFIEYQYRPKI